MGVVFLVLLALAGTVTVLLATRHGPYVSPDSVSYIGAARGLAAGDGFTAPPGTPRVGHFAPLYPVMLAGLDAVGLDPVDGARWLNALVLGATVLVVGLAVRRWTRQWWPALLGGVLVVGATDVLAYHSSALSDPLFALLALTAVVALAAYIEQRKLLLLGAATVLTALALLTRYVGIALVAAGAVVLVAYGAGRRRRGALEAAIYSVAAVVPVAAWVVWARSAPGRGTEGDIVFHSFSGRYLERGGRNLLAWVVPDSAPWWVALAVVVAVIGLLVVTSRSRDGGDAAERTWPVVSVVCAAFAVAYLAVVVLDRLFLDASALLDKRFLLPLHVVAIVGILTLAGARARRARAGAGGPARVDRDPLRLVTAGALGLLVLLQVADAGAWVRDSIDDGGTRRGGYTARRWEESAVIGAVRKLPPGVPVYTNGPDAIWFLTGRTTNMLPAEEDYLTGRSNSHYGAEVARMSAQLRAANGVVVYFATIKSRHTLPTVADLRRTMPLQRLTADSVGAIYAPSP